MRGSLPNDGNKVERKGRSDTISGGLSPSLQPAKSWRTMDSRNTPLPTSLVHASAPSSPPDTVESCDGYYYEFENGTTAIGFILNKEGVMVAVDHSSIPSGSFPQNVIVFHSHLLTTFSGGSKDSLERLPVYLQKKCHEYELKEGKKASAAEASKWLADFLSLHPDSDDRLSLGVLIAGWDNELGPALYKVNGKGKLRQSPYLGAGCGSSGSGGLSYRVLGNLSLADATEVAKKALCLGVCYVPESEGCVSESFLQQSALAEEGFGEFHEHGKKKPST
ncbi:OLC1v1006549C1 [Oldenlandia corymbosa var. corymbosa]|uniref:OLC1v1006549C1 n=1 Tax=Oldenlandia corymbosa var. corymbosa TaxID=529605 RepID=A0AAV1DHA1_OLDCO|nr:OLC1v1006549C1 [Oldenlandia corymbosa var. corymbosa]